MIDTSFSSPRDDLLRCESYKTLTPHERQAADRLLHLLVEFVDGLSSRSNLLPTKLLTKMVIKRLIQKLREKNLPDAAVKNIAGGVWMELHAASAVGHEVRTPREPAPFTPPEDQIVADIMKRINGRSSFIGAMFDKLLVTVGTGVNDRIIAVVAEEAWPYVKEKLGQ